MPSALPLFAVQNDQTVFHGGAQYPVFPARLDIALGAIDEDLAAKFWIRTDVEISSWKPYRQSIAAGCRKEPLQGVNKVKLRADQVPPKAQKADALRTHGAFR